MVILHPLSTGQVVVRMHIVNFSIEHTFAPTVWLGATKFSTITRVGRGVFLGVSHVPIPRGQGSCAPIFSVTWSTYAPWDISNNQILHVDHTRRQENFTGSTTPQLWPKKILLHQCWHAICLRLLTFLFMLTSDNSQWALNAPVRVLIVECAFEKHYGFIIYLFIGKWTRQLISMPPLSQ